MEFTETLPTKLPEVTHKSPLDRWLWQHRISGRWLADQIGVHESVVSRIRSGDKSQASQDTIDKIRRITNLKRL